MANYEYRGYRIMTARTTSWHANIWAPNIRFAMSDIPQATIAEGEDVLLERAHVVIDADLTGTRR